MRKVTLSFDNGPEPEVTPLVLDELAKHSTKATFFVMGRKVGTRDGKALAQRAAAEGHWIGNHTFTHTKPLGELDRVSALKEFEDAEKALDWLHQTPPLFRPYGRSGTLGRHLLHPAIVEKLVASRYTCVLWNCVPQDWKDPEGWMARALSTCQSLEWPLVVLHDLPNGAMKHLSTFLQTLIDSGVSFEQDYPPECVPIRDGQIVMPIEAYTKPAS